MNKKSDDDLLDQIQEMAIDGSKKVPKKKKTQGDLISGLDLQKKVRSDPLTTRVPRYVFDYYETLAKEKGVSISKLSGEILRKVADQALQN